MVGDANVSRPAGADANANRTPMNASSSGVGWLGPVSFSRIRRGMAAARFGIMNEDTVDLRVRRVNPDLSVSCRRDPDQLGRWTRSPFRGRLMPGPFRPEEGRRE